MLYRIVLEKLYGSVVGSKHRQVNLISSSSHVIRVSIASNRLPTKAQTLKLTQNILQQGRRGIPLWWWRGCAFIRSRWKILFPHPLTIYVFSISKRCNNSGPNSKRAFNFNKRLIIQRNVKVLEIKSDKLGIRKMCICT